VIVLVSYPQFPIAVICVQVFVDGNLSNVFIFVYTFFHHARNGIQKCLEQLKSRNYVVFSEFPLFKFSGFDQQIIWVQLWPTTCWQRSIKSRCWNVSVNNFMHV